MFDIASGEITPENESKWWDYVDLFYKHALRIDSENLAKEEEEFYYQYLDEYNEIPYEELREIQPDGDHNGCTVEDYSDFYQLKRGEEKVKQLKELCAKHRIAERKIEEYIYQQ